MTAYNWREKAAAAIAEDQVDREAAEKAFMDLAYALVANKGKALFRDPFRLGFEIIDTNEKFTKMHAIFAFRCGDTVLSVPVFFVNGDVLGGDSVYRGDVKRFSPFTDKWCAYLVRKASTNGGQMVDRNTQTQADAYMQRLSYPQFGKSATFGGAFIEKAASVWKEMVAHSLTDTETPLITPGLLKSAAYTTDDLADVMGDSDKVARYASRIYAGADFAPDIVKAASPTDIPNLYRVTDINMCKTAAQREEVAATGTSWDDKRTDFTPKHVTEEIPSREMIELTGGGPANVIMSCDDKFTLEKAVVLSNRKENDTGLYEVVSASDDGNYATVYFPGSKKIAEVSRRNPVFGFADTERETKTIEIGSAVTGKHYILVDSKVMTVLDRAFTVDSIVSVTDGKVLQVSPRVLGNDSLIFRAEAGRSEPERGFFNNDYRLLEVAAEKDDTDWFRPAKEDKLMTVADVDRWCRNAGTAELQSDDFKVEQEDCSGLFSMTHADESVSEHKVASSLTHDELVANLAVRCDLPVATAVVFAKRAASGPVKFRIYSSAGVEKSAYTTRIASPETWTTGYDPVLGAKTDWPQERTLQTITPQRRRQQARYGDHYVQDAPYAAGDPDEDGLPETDLLSMSPDLLAQKADKLGLPHILDHQVFSQLANRPTNSIAQVRKYLPGLETGVDHYARILFLIRYRPSEFEEAYGKEETQDMEEDISSLFQLSGDSLLRLLKRFDKDRYNSETQA